MFSLTAPSLLRQKRSKFKSCRCTYYSFTTPLLPWASALLSWRTGPDPISPLEPHPALSKLWFLTRLCFSWLALFGKIFKDLVSLQHILHFILHLQREFVHFYNNSWSISQQWQSEHILTFPHHNFSWCLLFQSAFSTIYCFAPSSTLPSSSCWAGWRPGGALIIFSQLQNWA